jgi:hypothetical protein
MFNDVITRGYNDEHAGSVVQHACSLLAFVMAKCKDNRRTCINPILFLKLFVSKSMHYTIPHIGFGSSGYTPPTFSPLYACYG